MMKQYGIDPRLVIWIQRNTGHDLQTFSDLAKMKSLDSRRRNFSSARKIEDIRLPSWLMVKENDLFTNPKQVGGACPKRGYHSFLHWYGRGLYPMAPIRVSRFQCGEGTPGDDPAGGGS